MKQIILTILSGIMVLTAYGQEENISADHNTKKEKLRLDRGPAIYINTSTGFNNNTAILGFNFELPLSSKVTIDAGPGTGTWGNKFYAGAKYYLKTAQRGFAFGAGLTYAPGVRGHYYEITTIYGDTISAQFNKNPQTNIFLAAYKYWSIGKQYNRIYAELGWSMPLSNGSSITQLTGDPISTRSERSLNSAAPGGPILAFGISFGIH